MKQKVCTRNIIYVKTNSSDPIGKLDISKFNVSINWPGVIIEANALAAITLVL